MILSKSSIIKQINTTLSIRPFFIIDWFMDIAFWQIEKNKIENLCFFIHFYSNIYPNNLLEY